MALYIHKPAAGATTRAALFSVLVHELIAHTRKQDQLLINWLARIFWLLRDHRCRLLNFTNPELMTIVVWDKTRSRVGQVRGESDKNARGNFDG